MIDLIGLLLGFIASIPPAYDDYKDYLVSDLSWILYIPFIIYIVLKYWREFLSVYMVTDYILFIIISISFYSIDKILGKEFGEADIILFLLLIFYEPIINLGFGIPDYFIIIIVQNIYGALYGLYRKMRGLEDRIPLVAATPFTIATFILLTLEM